MDRAAKVKTDPRRALPSVDKLVQGLEAERPGLPVWARIEAARRTLAEVRDSLGGENPGSGEPPDLAGLARRAARHAERLAAEHPTRVINATGIPLHTNLGRAPLAPGAVEAVARAASGYGDLELDLETGRRGNRLEAVCEKLVLLTGAEAAWVGNNNAAAVLLALDTLARGREAIVSRGELVEIGGSFRVPDIMARAGVDLVEVGTTNRTHLADYEGAIGEKTALLLKIHRSNFELRGFVAETSLDALGALGAEHGLPVVEDLGSGTLVDLTPHGFPAEIFAPARLRLGADVVCFSGDKLLGGPQAGIVLGSAEVVGAMRRNPLARALRLDKLSLAALDWTLGAHLDGRAERELPVLRQLLAPNEELEERARALAQRCEAAAGGQATCTVVADRAFVGGGSLPGFELDTWVVAVSSGGSAERLSARLREQPVPVIGRIRDDQLVLDVRTLLDGDEKDVEHALGAVFGAPGETAGARSR